MPETVDRKPYVDLDKKSVISYYENHTLVECAEFFNCSSETIKRRLILWKVKVRSKKEALRMWIRSEKSKEWRIKKSNSQRNKYKQYGKAMFSKEFVSQIGSINKYVKSSKGKLNGNWKGGNSSSYWRQLILSKYEAKCSECGWDEVPEALHAHHIDFNRNNNSLENGKVLCPNCHYVLHFQERGYK
jgi:hypothetical protein